MWCQPVSPRLASLGILPRGHRLLDRGFDLLLETVNSCLTSRRAYARPSGLGEAGRPGFVPMSSIFGTYSPEIKTHPKLVEVIRNK